MSIFLKAPELKEKFKRLEIYFPDELEEEDLCSQNLEIYVGFAEPSLKGLMDAFIQNHFAPYLEQSYVPKIKTGISPTPFAYHKDSSLLGANRVLPTRMNHLGRTTIKDLGKVECPLKNVTKIDLSDNHLGSADLGYVLELVQKLNADCKLSEATILLNNNRIYGIQQMEEYVRVWLNKLVEIENVKYVDLRVNPFCSVDQQAFLEGIRMPNSVESHTDLPIFVY